MDSSISHNGHVPTSELLDRRPPCDLAAEQMVLRNIIVDGRLIDGAADLTAEHFVDEANRQVFAAVAALKENQKPIDVCHVEQELRDSDQLDRIGGRSFLVDILGGDLAQIEIVKGNNRSYQAFRLCDDHE